MRPPLASAPEFSPPAPPGVGPPARGCDPPPPRVHRRAPPPLARESRAAALVRPVHLLGADRACPPVRRARARARRARLEALPCPSLPPPPASPACSSPACSLGQHRGLVPPNRSRESAHRRTRSYIGRASR